MINIVKNELTFGNTYPYVHQIDHAFNNSFVLLISYGLPSFMDRRDSKMIHIDSAGKVLYYESAQRKSGTRFIMMSDREVVLLGKTPGTVVIINLETRDIIATFIDQ
jgi:hypothetical protein